MPKSAKFKNLHPQAKTNTFLYDGGNLFTYPVYSIAGCLQSNIATVKNPIIIVEKPVFSNLPTSSLLVNNPLIVVELIRKHKLTVRFGSLTNGLLSVEVKINNMLTKKMILVISTVLSIVTSLLLFIVMNSVYFYHRRRVHFLERLAGKGLLVIHKK